MKDSIYTIPISEVFEPKSGCPLCSLRSSLEERWVDYITGAAMMEPDVRIETNMHGFCAKHYDMTLNRRNRLSVALMLLSRLDHLNNELKKDLGDRRGSAPGHSSRLSRKAALFRRGSSGLEENHSQRCHKCFICLKTDGEILRIARNIASVWEKDKEFRELFADQKFICYTHAEMLLYAAQKELHRTSIDGFRAVTVELTLKKLRSVKAAIDSFCGLFDYRNAHSPQPDREVSEAVERAIEYLNGK